MLFLRGGLSLQVLLRVDVLRVGNYHGGVDYSPSVLQDGQFKLRVKLGIDLESLLDQVIEGSLHPNLYLLIVDEEGSEYRFLKA